MLQLSGLPVVLVVSAIMTDLRHKIHLLKIYSRVGGDAVVVEKIKEGGGPNSNLDGRSQSAVLGEGVLVVPSIKEKLMYTLNDLSKLLKYHLQ